MLRLGFAENRTYVRIRSLKHRTVQKIDIRSDDFPTEIAYAVRNSNNKLLKVTLFALNGRSLERFITRPKQSLAYNIHLLSLL